jgi:hypothetical protein
MRYTVNKAELDIEGYELFPGEFPIGAKRGIIIYVKKSLIALEVKIDTNFKESAWHRFVITFIIVQMVKIVLFIFKVASVFEPNHNIVT